MIFRLLFCLSFSIFILSVFGEEHLKIEEEYIIDRPKDIKQDDSISVIDEEIEDEILIIKSGKEIESVHSLKTSFLSLIFPGLGEYKIGLHKLGKSLMIADGLLWIGVGAAFFFRSLVKDDLRAYLYTYGDCDGKKSLSRRDAWDLSDNELELPLYVDSSAYYEVRIYGPSRDTLMKEIDFYWQWDSEAAHQEYYDMWKKANRVKLMGYYFMGGALLARVVSYINTRRIIKKAGMDKLKKTTAAFSVKPYFLHLDSYGIMLSCRF